MAVFLLAIVAIVFCPLARASFVEDGLKRMAVLEKKLTSLADSTPADKFSWRPPGRGRSVAEFYLHVAVANFSFGRNVGVALPESVNLDHYENSVSAKSAVIQQLHQSFAYYRNVLEKLKAADGDKPINFFGQRTTLQKAVPMTLDHINLHLDQCLAVVRLDAVKEKSKQRPTPAGLKMNVIVYNLANVPRRTLTAAEHITARAFQQVGIETAWIECARGMSPSALDAACATRPSGSLYLQMRIVPQGNPRDTIVGLAIHNSEVGVFDTFATIYFNQVDKLSLEFAQESGNGMFSGIAWQPTWSEVILGTSMTHELGHLLLGTTHTQDDGIMMPSFGRTDLLRTYSRADCFDPHQAVQLRNEIVVRAITDFGFHCRYQTKLSGKLPRRPRAALPFPAPREMASPHTARSPSHRVLITAAGEPARRCSTSRQRRYSPPCPLSTRSRTVGRLSRVRNRPYNRSCRFQRL